MASSADQRLRELYDELPTIRCKGLCANSCGPIDMTDTERQRLVNLGVEIPVFTAEASRRWAAGARLDCPALGPFRNCTVYNDRPLICRLWGMTESMPCPHGCQPSRVLSDEEGYDFLFRAMLIGGHRKFGSAKVIRAVRERYESFMDDATLGPLFTRFIQGERGAELEIVAEMRRRGWEPGA